MPLQYHDKIVIEQLRSLEQTHQAITIRAQPSSNFDDYLLQRVEQAKLQPSLKAWLETPSRHFHFALMIFCFVAFAVGAFAIISALSGQATLNVFWVLIVLLGFHVVSFILWLVLSFLLRAPLKSPIPSLLIQSVNWLVKKTSKNSTSEKSTGEQPPYVTSAKAWFTHHFAMPQGRWLMGVIVHGVWLSYLVGGTLALILSLMTRQFDFVWGSTLLSNNAFEQLTQVLSAPMALVNWPTPSLELIALSQQGAHDMTADTRAAWGYFLLGCLMFYGVIPRLLAWASCRLMCAYRLRQFDLKYSDAYYLTLQHAWQPSSSIGRIVDPDSELSKSVHAQIAPHSQQKLPAAVLSSDALVIGIELSALTLKEAQQFSDQYLPTCSMNVVDKETTLAAHTLIEQHQQTLVLMVNAHKPPDRGIRRLLTEFIKRQNDTWIVCLNPYQAAPEAFLLWQQEALRLKLEPKQCLLLNSAQNQPPPQTNQQISDQKTLDQQTLDQEEQS
ncbi:MAG: DUF2868 domain-containing protein [Oleibacter sp.]|nr:DUF2868 domain-containing protein [Thalassolituus sp.]